MSPSLSLNFDYIDQLITKGEYDEAIQALITFENKQGLSDTEQLSCLIRRSTILNRLGQYNESFLLSQEVFQESKKQNYTLLLLDAIILMGTNLWRLGRLDESYTILEQGEQEIQKQPLYYASEYKQRVSSLIFNKGIVCRYQGNLDRALDYLQQSLALRIELGNEQGIAASLAYLGVIYHVRGQLENALTYYQQSLEIRRKSENKQGIAYAINNIGVVYHQQGDFEQALMHYFESKRYFDEINDKQGVSYPLNNIGISYYQQNDLKQGLHFLEQSLDFRRITGNNLLVAETLFFLLPVVIDCKDLDKAQDYVQQLKLISKETENKVVKQQYLVTKALLLKQSTRGRSLIKAAELLEQVVSEEIVDYNITVLALLNLCEILLTELKLSEDQEVYDEICIHVKRLIEIGKQQYSYSLLAETYWLQARLALLNLEMKKARNLLTQAQFIADEKGFR
ncbi:MAG: tetratricopeptide repeat protein, partial [Candidatus Heimdallarchaeota archaeon]|nr:tetratricopeptide repeat protein [Candidatus Heimdallarchaeota archaeon]MCK5047985.1 tetratricopeptide repeat protein [Candidatus Heimdallarchaeota archaeon]